MTTSKSGWASFLLIILSASMATAFTNGTLLPQYLCDLKDQAKGSPQSLANVLPFLAEDNATMIVAQYHHLNDPPFTQARNLCTVDFLTNGTNLPGQKTFIVKAIDNTTQIVGLILWVQKRDAVGALNQIGTIVTPGLNMIPYPYGCNGDRSQTIVHKTVLHRTAVIRSQSGPIVWDMNGDTLQAGEKAQVAGICVTQAPKGQPGGGFGKFVVDMALGTSTPAPPVLTIPINSGC